MALLLLIGIQIARLEDALHGSDECVGTDLSIGGFDLDSKSPLLYFDAVSAMIENMITIVVIQTDFRFYYQGMLVDADLCDADVFEDVHIQIFAKMDFASFLLKTTTILRCQFARTRSRTPDFRTLNVYRPWSTRLFKNELTFLEIKNPRNMSINLNSRIIEIELHDIYKTDIDLRLISPHVFGNLLFLFVQGQPDLLHAELFRTFRKLVSFKLVLGSVRDFFHSSENKWLALMYSSGREFESQSEMENFNSRTDLSGYGFFRLLIGEDGFTASYRYPTEDFCLFKHFPIRKAVLTGLMIETLFPKIESFEYNETDLIGRLGLCNTTDFASIPLQGGLYFNYFQFSYVFEWLEFVGPVVTFPILAAISVPVQSRHHPWSSPTRATTPTSSSRPRCSATFCLNSVFNCIECFIYQFQAHGHVHGRLLGPTARASDSKWLTSPSTSNGYLSETIKTASILTGLLFSIVRYAETSKTENWLMKIICNAPIRIVSFGVSTS
ncbi:unnamed protein product [Sphagnum compactum]